MGVGRVRRERQVQARRPLGRKHDSLDLACIMEVLCESTILARAIVVSGGQSVEVAGKFRRNKMRGKSERREDGGA